MDSVEWIARYIAAKKMGLVKDPKGLNLPKELWQQCIGDAKEFMDRGLRPPDFLYTKDKE